MKKILRLVTTSVLTLTLVACGEASSSVSSSVSSSASSSVASSSVASSFAAVTSITLAPAATDALTQVVGSLKTVVINASFNTGVNPDLRVSWLVNGVASQQTGRAFEFTPTAAGVFKIKARVGTVESQEQTVTVTAQGVSTLAITSHTFVSTTRLEVVATGGATVVVTGATLDKDASFYDLEGKKYVLILEEALEQGDSVKVSLTRDGSTAEDTFVYDTRKLELDLTALATTYKAEITAGTVALTATKITLVRPHILDNDGNVNAASLIRSFPFKVTDLNGLEVPFSVTRTSAPASALPAAVNQGSTDITVNKLPAGTTIKIDVPLTRETPLGDYVYAVTVGAKTVNITVTVEDTKPTLALEDDQLAAADSGAAKTSFQVTQLSAGTANKISSVTATGTDKDIFEVTKDYALGSLASKEIRFNFKATNISVPTNLLGTINQSNSVKPNQMLVSLAGPGGISFMRVDTTNSYSQQTLPPPVPFRNRAEIDVLQRIDSVTPVGDYVYTVRILQLGTEIHRESITVTVKDPVAKLSFAGTMATPSVMQKDDVLTGMLLHPDVTLSPDFTAAAFATAPDVDNSTVGDLYFNTTSPTTLFVSTAGTPKTWVARVTTIGQKLFNSTDNKVYVATSAAGVFAPITYKAAALQSAPTVGATGALYFDTSDSKLYISTAGTPNTWVAKVTVAGELLLNTTSGVVWSATNTSGTFAVLTGSPTLPKADFQLLTGTTATLSCFSVRTFADAIVAGVAQTTDLLHVTETAAYRFNGTQFADNASSRGWKQLESGFILQSTSDIFQITKTGEVIGGTDIATASNKYFLDQKTAQVYKLTGSTYGLDVNNLISLPTTTPEVTINAVGGVKPTTGIKAGDYWFDETSKVLELASGTTPAYAPVTPAQAPVGTRIYVSTGTTPNQVYVAFDNDLSNTTYTVDLEADTPVNQIGWRIFTNNNYAILKNAETATTFESYQLLTRGTSDTADWAVDDTKYNSVKELIDNELSNFNGNQTPSSKLASALQVQMLETVDLLFIESDKLRTTELKVETKDVAVTTPLTVVRPSFAYSPTAAIELRFDATIANYQSPLNPTAAAANSFTAVANAAGLAGTREFVTFQKSYTGPQTLPATNVVNEKVALLSTDTTSTTYTADDQVNRVTGPNAENFDKIVGGRTETKLTGTRGFVFDVTNTTTLGTYVFTMTVGPLTQSFTVIVEAPKQEIVLVVEDTLAERILTPTTAGVINVNLNEDSLVELDFGIKLLNMEKATGPQTVSYVLTRSYSFGSTKWNDLKEDVFTGTTVSAQTGTLLAPSEFLSILRGTDSHVDIDDLLTLEEPGTYTYKLQIGSITRSWSVVVSKFPTLEIVSATLGTEDDADTNPLAIMQSLESGLDLDSDEISTVIIVEERTESNETGLTSADRLDHLYLTVKGVNLPAGAIYFQITDSASAPKLDVVTDKAITFASGLATIKIEDSVLGTSTNFDSYTIDIVYAHIYNSSKVAVGYVAFLLAVIDFEQLEVEVIE